MFAVVLLTFALLSPAGLTPPPIEILGPIEMPPGVELSEAVRLTPPAPQAAAEPVLGLHGMPFAPEGLDNCAEARFYREQAGLPARFDALTWRESNCRQELGVHTGCCWGYLQLSISLHLRDQRLIGPYHDCGIYSREDADGPEPIEKQRHMCAAKALYSLLGYQPWSL